jgi:predicted amidohydrolase YtcJ
LTAPIIPMAGDDRAVEALAVKDGRIAAVGALDVVMGLKSASTEIVELDGRAMLPGFIDAHQHTVTGALINALFVDCGYTKYKTRDALMAMFRDRAAKTPRASGSCSPASTICCRGAT